MENLPSYLRLDDSKPLPELMNGAELTEKYNFGIILNFSDDEVQKLTLHDPNYRMAMGLSPNIPKAKWIRKLDVKSCISWTKYLNKRKNKIDLNSNAYENVWLYPLLSGVINETTDAIERRKYNKNLQKEKEAKNNLSK